MNKYFFRYYLNSSFSFGGRVDHVKGNKQQGKFTFENIELTIYERLFEQGGKFVFDGLGIDVYVSNDDYTKANILASNSANIILCFMSFCSLTTYSAPYLIEEYDAGESITERPIKFYLHPNYHQEIDKTIRPLKMDVFKEIWTKSQKFISDNVLSSMFQLNKSFSTIDKKDEFIYLWLGIEYTAGLLNDKFFPGKYLDEFPKCKECKAELKSCQHCGVSLKRQRGLLEGVKKIALDRIGMTNKQFNEIHEVRSRLMHNSSSFNPDKYIYVDSLRMLLIYCLGEVLEIDKPLLETILTNKPLRSPYDINSNRIMFSAKLIGYDKLPNIIEVNEHPSVQFEDNNITMEINNDGSVKSVVSAKYKYKGQDKSRLDEVLSYAIIQQDTGLKSVDLTVEKVN